MQTCENMLADMGTHFMLVVTLGMDAVHVNTMSMSTDICAGMALHQPHLKQLLSCFGYQEACISQMSNIASHDMSLCLDHGIWQMKCC